MAKKIINESSRAHFIQRMQQLADIKKPVNEGIRNTDLIDYKRAANGSAYAIIKESHNYYIKVSNCQNEKLSVADFAFIGGLENKLNYQYKSVAEADKNRNLLLININEGFKKIKADNSKTKMVILKEGAAVTEEFGKENDAEETPEDNGGDEKSDIDAAASKLDDLDAAADAEKAEPAPADMPSTTTEPSASTGSDIEGAADAAGGLDDIGGEEPSATGDAPAGGSDVEASADDAAAGLDAIGGGEDGVNAQSDGDKAEFKKLVGKVQQQASTTEMTPEEAIANLKQILSGFKGAIDGLDDVQKKEIANKILKAEPEGEEGGDDAAGLDGDLEGDEEKIAAESLSGFKQHVSEMGYDPANTSSMSMMEMVGVMNSYFNKMEDSGEAPDYEGLAEYMNEDIIGQLQECGYGDHAEKAQPFMGETLVEYGSEEPMAASIGEEGEEEEEEVEIDAEAGAEEIPAEEPIDAEDDGTGVEDEEGLEDVTSEIPSEEPAAAPVDAPPAEPVGAGPSAIAPIGDVMGVGMAGGTKKSVTVDLKNDTINLSVNESNEGKLRKIVKRRIEEKLGLKKPVLSESNSPLLKLIDKYIEDEIKKRK